MKTKDIEIGQVYAAKISGRIVAVRILSISRYCDKHFIAENLRTKRQVVIRSGQKLRAKLEPFYKNDVRLWRKAQ